MPYLIVNADDFGISPGVNAAIINSYNNGILNSASIMMNVAYTNEAVRLASENPNLKIGVHLNLSNQKNQMPLSGSQEIPLLVNAKGQLKYGFVGLFLLSIFKSKDLKKQSKIEMKKQIDKAIASGIEIAHLDSHRHVHMIPVLFSAVKELQKEYKIPRVRVINENCFKTFFTSYDLKCLWFGGIIKYGILKTFYYINRTKSDTYYYSIMYTTKMFGNCMKKVRVPKKFSSVEIALHPSIIEEDKKKNSTHFEDYLLFSEDRYKEYETAMDKGLPSLISY